MRRFIIGSLAVFACTYALGSIWCRQEQRARPTPRGRVLRTGDVAPATQIEAPEPWQGHDTPGLFVLEGRVVGPQGEGISGAEVTLISAQPRKAISGAGGTFSFPALASREYLITATHGDRIGGPALSRLTGKSEPVVIRLRQGGALDVTITDELARPIPDAVVTARSPLGNVVRATTDAGGRGRLAPLGSDMVIVEASARNFSPGSVSLSVETKELTLVLRSGYSVSGRVVDDVEKVVVGARVTAMFDGHVFDTSATTDDEGRFTIATLANGHYKLLAEGADHAPAPALPLKVAGEPLWNIEIVMPTGGTLSGVVYQGAHQPVPFAFVEAIGVNASGHIVPREGTCDRDGRFTLRGLVRSRQNVRAEAEAASSSVAEVDLTKGAGLANLELMLNLDGSISGTVVDGRGRPVEGVNVTAVPAFSEAPGPRRIRVASAGLAGEFSFTGLPEGNFLLGATAAPFEIAGPPQTSIGVSAGARDVQITLEDPGSITGRVLLPEGAPKAFSVIVTPSGGLPVAGVNGVFTLRGIPPGTVNVLLRSAEFADVFIRDVKVTGSYTTDLGTRIVMRGRQITGLVLDARGAPAAGAEVKVVIQPASKRFADFEALNGIRSAVADKRGAFAISGLPERVGAPVNTMAIIGYDPEHGASAPFVLPEGSADVQSVTLQLGQL
jgi:Carboxypeptidase regulatory-like domain